VKGSLGYFLYKTKHLVAKTTGAQTNIAVNMAGLDAVSVRNKFFAGFNTTL
jgi:hypothetical protein